MGIYYKIKLASECKLNNLLIEMKNIVEEIDCSLITICNEHEDVDHDEYMKMASARIKENISSGVLT